MEEGTWNVLDSYFQNNKNFLTKHHLDSYNDFIFNKIPFIIKSLNPYIVLKNDDQGKPLHEIRIYIAGINGDAIYFNKPTISEDKKSRLLLPNEARLKKLTYSSDIYVDIDVLYINKLTNKDKKVEFKKIKIGTIPIMLHSKLCSLYQQPPHVLREMGECPFDQGGYFVVDGKEKVIVAQERITTNRLYINKGREADYAFDGVIRCTTEQAAIFPKTVGIKVFAPHKSRKNAIVFSIPNIEREVPLFAMFRLLGVESDKEILEHILYDLDDGVAKIMKEFLFYSIVDGSFIYTQEEALAFFAQYVEYKNTDYVRFVITNDLFPNMNEVKEDGTTQVSLTKKALFLGHVANNIVKICLGLMKESDRDNYAFKRVDLSGFLMSNLFRDFYNLFRNECRNNVDKEYNLGPWSKEDDISNLINDGTRWKVFNSNLIENGMVRSLKGSWGINKDPSKAGIVQDVSRLSYIGFVSHLRRVNTPIDRSIKIVAPHRLHPSQYGCMCPCESPDGASIGLLKNFAMLCYVTFDCSSKEILACLKDLGITLVEHIVPADVIGNAKVLINNNWVGITNDPDKIVRRLRLLRRNGLINITTSISWNIFEGVVNINTDAGRCCRPLYIVKSANKLSISPQMLQKLRTKQWTWFDLVRGGSLDSKDFDVTNCRYISPYDLFGTKDEDEITNRLEENAACIEYIDVEEANTCMIAMQFKDLENQMVQYTHCEIHPSTIFAVLTANIPFANHNQAPRNYFSGAQGKQAIGVYNTQFNNRMDTASLVLHYPQRRLVNTRYMNYINNNALPNGYNTIVAIMTYTGYNQEDALIINEGAIRRGLFNLTYYKTIVMDEEENPFTGEKIVFANPTELVKNGIPVEEFGKRFANYTKIDENGLPKENVKIGEGDVYVGKTLVKAIQVDDDDQEKETLFKKKKKAETYKDKSVVAEKIMSGTVDKVFCFKNESGLRTAKIRFRKVRIPELGDKHGSSHAQKGTIGMIIPHENMPYTADGIVPDLIINPHAIPTRMTIAHLVECVMSKLGCLEGQFYDGTPWCNQNIESSYERLERHGYERYGNEIMYNGITGEQIPTEIFIGPTYYLRFKHMVADKINSRAGNGESGYTGLTRQPVKSRAKAGGLRIGEMETGAILAHGISSFLRESTMERSDKYDCFIEDDTGDIARANGSKGYFDATTEANKFSHVQIPFAAKTFIQELQTMSICPKLVLGDQEVGEDFFDDCEMDEEDVGAGDDDTRDEE